MMVFGPDGNLYVTSNFTGSPFAPGSVLRYEGPSGPNPGAFLGTFVPAGSGGLANPTGLLFGPDGRNDGKLDLYVASSVMYFTGSLSETFAAEPGTSEVLRYDGRTGAFLGTFVTPDSGGLQLPTLMTFTETDPVTLNYDGATTSTTRTAATTSIPTQPAAAPVTNTASPLIASSSTSPAPLLASPTPGSSNFDPAALAVALSLSQRPETPEVTAASVMSFVQAPLLTPSLTSNLPPASSSKPGSTAEAASDRILANFEDGLSLALLADDLALVSRSFEESWLQTESPW